MKNDTVINWQEMNYDQLFRFVDLRQTVFIKRNGSLYHLHKTMAKNKYQDAVRQYIKGYKKIPETASEASALSQLAAGALAKQEW